MQKIKKGKKSSNQQPGDEGNALFVRGLPSSTSSKQLEEFFGGVGPLRRSFVVTDGKTERCTGVGFLHFALREDAKKALEVLQGATFGGRRIQLDYARRRQRRLPETSNGDSETVTPAQAPEEPAETKRGPPLKTKGNFNGSVGNRTVVVKSDAKDAILDAQIVLNKLGDEPRAAGFESYVSSADGTILRFLFRTWPQAGVAASRIHGDGLDACVEALSGGRKCKLIVRNLPFKLNVAQVRGVFRQIANVREITVPVPNNQRSDENAVGAISLSKVDAEFVSTRGFGFVEYFLAADANKAIEKVNGMKIGGRPVAVDLALGKSEFAKKIAENTAPEITDTVEESAEDEVSDEDPAGSSAPNEDGADKPVRKAAESSEEEMERTAFVRNLLFETSSSELWTAMESKFGSIEQAVVVKDPITGRSRGTAFVRFASAEQLNSALSPTESGLRNGGTFTLQGRDLLIVPALKRDHARDKVVGTNEKTDRRNMRLAWIGHIKGDSAEGLKMSEADLGKRMKAEKEKRAKLSNNPNAFVSDTRLCIRNLPKFVDEKVLKYICLGILQVKSGRADSARRSFPKITHAKVVRDARRNNKSRGFGFVQFGEHRHALQALHRLNNNAKAIEVVLEAKAKSFGVDEAEVAQLRREWGKDRRLFVEFSVEDSRTVAILNNLKKSGKLSTENVGTELKRQKPEAPSDKNEEKEEAVKSKRRRKKNGKAKEVGEDRFENLVENYKLRLKNQ